MKPPLLARYSGILGQGLKSCLSAGADFVFPPACPGCGEAWNRRYEDSQICPDCLLHAAPPQTFCRRCAAPVAPASPAAGDCALCRGVRLHFDRALALGVYRELLREFVLRMKHSAGESLALSLGAILAVATARELSDVKFRMIVPVPMPWTRRLARSANSAELLAEAMGRRLRAPVIYRALRCRRNPKRQSSLPPSRRFANVRGAYRAAKGYDFNAAHVLLVDDIMTTGATASEAAKALKQAGAATVCVATVARGVGDA